jgi:hypothetical protein
MIPPAITQLARFLYDRQADSYDADPAMRELAWADLQIRRFWIDEATAVIHFLAALELSEVAP